MALGAKCGRVGALGVRPIFGREKARIKLALMIWKPSTRNLTTTDVNQTVSAAKSERQHTKLGGNGKMQNIRRYPTWEDAQRAEMRMAAWGDETRVEK